ncbi:MAG: hypothetical protein LBQ47_08995 [Endomicrobium sp.]|nr:hypothetical protein [Endomicrobium sp.]
MCFLHSKMCEAIRTTLVSKIIIKAIQRIVIESCDERENEDNQREIRNRE